MLETELFCSNPGTGKAKPKQVSMDISLEENIATTATDIWTVISGSIRGGKHEIQL